MIAQNSLKITRKLEKNSRRLGVFPHRNTSFLLSTALQSNKRMLRYQKPTLIELKKSDVDELLQKRRDVIAKSPNEISMCQQPVLPSTSSPKLRQAEIRRRLGFSPDVVSNDGTTAIHF